MADETKREEPRPRGRVGLPGGPDDASAAEASKQTDPGLAQRQAAQQALQTQNKPMTLVDALSEEQQAALAASIGENGEIVADEVDEAGNVTRPGTAGVVRRVVQEYYDAQKATDESLERPDGLRPATTSAIEHISTRRRGSLGPAQDPAPQPPQTPTRRTGPPQAPPKGPRPTEMG